MKLIYLANARLPTEKAHGGQIMLMCEALAEAGAEVTLWYPRRANKPELDGRDPFDYYDVARTFAMQRVASMDPMPLATRLRNRWGSGRVAFFTQTLTFAAALRWRLRRADFDALYTRDPFILLALGLTGLGRRAFYEAHTFPGSRAAQRLQRFALRRAAGLVTITGGLQTRYAGVLGVPTEQIHVSHDAVDLARFNDLPGKLEARRALGLPEDAFIAGYVGRFHTMTMPKGLDTLAEAAAQTGDVHVCLVGGPAAVVDALRAGGSLPAERLHYVGAVPMAEVPQCLVAFDVCTIPFPWTQHFAYYASPIKLFEYMASRRPIVATDLPSIREVVQHEESALLVPHDDPPAMAAALRRLADDPTLGQRLAGQARALVEARYTWRARAEGIIDFIDHRQTASRKGA
jgi:glycosyltransferase involved in cell wall biosynthesis